jgi:hypothetical protein
MGDTTIDAGVTMVVLELDDSPVAGTSSRGVEYLPERGESVRGLLQGLRVDNVTQDVARESGVDGVFSGVTGAVAAATLFFRLRWIRSILPPRPSGSGAIEIDIFRRDRREPV